MRRSSFLHSTAVHGAAKAPILWAVGNEPRQPDDHERGVHRDAGAVAADRLDALSRRVVAGEEAALGELHDALTPGLTRHFARKLGGGRGLIDQAEELAQLTWVQVWALLQQGKYDPSRARLTTYVYAVAAVVWMRWGRERERQQRRAGVAIGGEEIAAGEMGADDAATLAAQIERVREALAGQGGGFTPVERDALRAIAEGGTDRELAARLGVAASTANERRKTLLARLAKWLGN